MTYEELMAGARTQTALLLIRYHLAVYELLNELLDAIPQQYPYGQQASQAVRRFRAKVQVMAVDWCGS